MPTHEEQLKEIASTAPPFGAVPEEWKYLLALAREAVKGRAVEKAANIGSMTDTLRALESAHTESDRLLTEIGGGG